MRQAFTTYIGLQSVTRTAEIHNVSRQTIHRRGGLRPRPGSVPPEAIKAWAHALRFDARLTIILENKLHSFNVDAVSWDSRKEKKLGKVLEDAEKKKRRDSKKSAVSL